MTTEAPPIMVPFSVTDIIDIATGLNTAATHFEGLVGEIEGWGEQPSARRSRAQYLADRARRYRELAAQINPGPTL